MNEAEFKEKVKDIYEYNNKDADDFNFDYVRSLFKLMKTCTNSTTR